MSGLVLRCTQSNGLQIDRVNGVDRSALVSFLVVPVQGRMLVEEFLETVIRVPAEKLLDRIERRRSKVVESPFEIPMSLDQFV
jgi:hypothetical protein